jgi:hypothetical protein
VKIARLIGFTIATIWVALVGAAGCAHPFTGMPSPGSSPSPRPSPSVSPGGSPSPSPAPCSTQNPAAYLVFMSANAAPTSDPHYGPLFGYTNNVDGTGQPLPTTIITVVQSTEVQFVNYDFNQTHSAASVTGSTFPPASPDPFPSGATQPIGTSITTSPWSTGLVQAATTFYCFSQTFTTPAVGTYLFGDLQTYGSTNTRDVLVVQP